ncbi:MAG: hypothetical protein K0S99_3859, partial [Thermomicrobiales bacterium]|nr:hypothetical protein [Thermomicrobiales bacterium]
RVRQERERCPSTVAAPVPMTTILTLRIPNRSGSPEALPCRRRRDRSLHTIRTGQSAVTGRDCRRATWPRIPSSHRSVHRAPRMTTPFSQQTILSVPTLGSSSSMKLPSGETTRRCCPNSTSAYLRRAVNAVNRPQCEVAASPYPGPGERHDVADPAPRAHVVGALAPLSPLRCLGSSPDPHSWRTRRPWH